MGRSGSREDLRCRREVKHQEGKMKRNRWGSESPSTSHKHSQSSAPSKDQGKRSQSSAPSKDQSKHSQSSAPSKDQDKHSQSSAPSKDQEKRSQSSAPSKDQGITQMKVNRKRDSSSSSSSSSSSFLSSGEEKRKKRSHSSKKRKAKDRKRKKKRKKEKKKLKKKMKMKSETPLDARMPAVGMTENLEKQQTELDVTDEQKARIQALRPMTREEWDARQSVIRRVVDPETGRSRIIKGDGEVLEEIVSRERHKEINKLSTMGDGFTFQVKMGLNQR